MKKYIYTTFLITIFAIGGFASVPTRASAATVFSLDQFIMIIRTLNLNIDQIIQLLPLVDVNGHNMSDDSDDDSDDDDYDPTQSDTYPQQTFKEVATSASVISQDGANNDTATFLLEFSLNAFGSDAYVSEFAQNAVEYSITDSNDGTVVYHSDGSVEQGTILVSLSSSGDLDDDEYRINEGTHEQIMLDISYNPHGGLTPAGSGSYRFQLEGINYRTDNTTTTYQTGSQTKFRTNAVNIVN